MSKALRFLILLLTSLILTFLIGRNFILSEGYIYLAENFEVYTVQDFSKVVYPLWNEKIQAFTTGSQPKLYLYTLVSLIAGSFGSYKLLQVLLLLLPYPIGFLSSFKLCEHAISKSMHKDFPEKSIFLSAFSAAFVFTVNPWFAMNPRNATFRIQYAFLPLLLYLFIRLLESKNPRLSICFAGILALVAGYRYTSLVTLMFLVVSISYIVLSKKNWREHVSGLGRAFFAYVLFVLLSLAKFLPAILHSLFVPVEAAEQFMPDMLRRETLFHIFTTKIYEWPASGFDMTYDDMTHFLFIAVSAFAFTYLLNRSRKQQKNYFYLMFPPLVFVVFVLLTSKELNLDSLILQLPYSDFFGRLLRHARWNIMPIVVSISVMLGLSIVFSLSKLMKRAYPLLLVILVCASISAWPMFTGDMNRYWTPTEPPVDYIEINNILEAQERDHHALWAPDLIRRAVWSKQTGISETTASMGMFSVMSSAMSSYSTWQHYFFDYYNPLRGGPGMSPLPIYGGDLSKVYSPLNVKYLMLHYDGGWTIGDSRRGFTNEYIKEVANDLDGYNWTRTLYEGKYVSAFELENDAKEFDIGRTFLVAGKLSSIGSIASLQSEGIPSIIFRDSSIVTPIEDVSDFPIVVADGDIFIPLISRAKAIPPKDFSNIFDPKSRWSPSSVDDSTFQSFLYREQIEWNWQFDYGKGLVFTSAPNAKLTMSLNVEKDVEYKLFIRYFENQHGGLINVYFNGRSIQVDTVDQLNRFVWKDLGTYHPEEGKHGLDLENVEGFNVVNLFVIVPQEDYHEAETQIRKLLKDETVIYVFEAESDLYWQNAHITNIYGAEASQGKVLRLEGMRGAVMFDGEKDYVEVQHNSSLNMEDQVTISLWLKAYDSESDQILVAKNDWANFERAVLPIRLNDETYMMRIVDPRSQGNDQHEWKFFSPSNVVQEGVWQHIVFVVDTTTVHSVARFYLNGELMKEETDEEAEKTIDSLKTNELPLNIGSGFDRRHFSGEISEVHIYNRALGSREIKELYEGMDPRQVAPYNLVLYFSPVMQDIGDDTIEVLHDLSGNGNDGTVYGAKPILDVQGGRVWQDVGIVKDGTYRLAMRGKGEFNISFGGTAKTLYVDELSLAYLSPVYIDAGTHRLEISSSEDFSYLDTVWLYSTQRENETLESIFTPKENSWEIISHRKIDPTKYIVKVNATTPFMLSFAEAYDPLWVAYVNGKRIEPVPLYSVINGFWVNQTGQLEIIIEYEPQKWFYYSSIISIATFFACLVYLTYDSTKNKEIWKRMRASLNARANMVLKFTLGIAGRRFLHGRVTRRYLTALSKK